MLAKAIVINSYADYSTAEPLANHLKAPIYTYKVAKGREVAKELFVVGGSKDGLKADKITVLAGDNRYSTAEKVANYLK